MATLFALWLVWLFAAAGPDRHLPTFFIIETPLVLTAILWLSGRTVIEGETLRTGSRFRPRTYSRDNVIGFRFLPMQMGRWSTEGLYLEVADGGEPIPLWFTGGITPNDRIAWERGLRDWLRPMVIPPETPPR